MSLTFGVAFVLEVVLLAVYFEQGGACHAKLPVRSTSRLTRSIQEPSESDDLKVVPMSRDFGLYDSNEDGYITIQEFAGFLGIDVESGGDVHVGFNRADKNGDGILSKDEFQNAPFVFAEGDVTDGSSSGDVMM